jgi:hypothetical protein
VFAEDDRAAEAVDLGDIPPGHPLLLLPRQGTVKPSRST